MEHLLGSQPRCVIAWDVKQSSISRHGVRFDAMRVAVAADGHNALAMLKRRPDETLSQLLTRLDQAIDRAWTEEIYTDEINPPASLTFRAARKR